MNVVNIVNVARAGKKRYRFTTFTYSGIHVFTALKAVLEDNAESGSEQSPVVDYGDVSKQLPGHERGVVDRTDGCKRVLRLRIAAA